MQVELKRGKERRQIRERWEERKGGPLDVAMAEWSPAGVQQAEEVQMNRGGHEVLLSGASEIC